MTTAGPLVTIGVPTYNSARYLRESLDSILAQTYPNWEIIVSDNASQDGTVAILREYAERHRIRLLLNKGNVGAGGNFNRLINEAHGEYVAIYHSDDLYLPTIVEESVRVMEENPEVGLVSTLAHAIDGDGRRLFTYELTGMPQRDPRGVYGLDEALMGVLAGRKNRLFFVTPSVMVRTSVYRELGGFDQPAFSSSCDTEMWLRIAAKYRVAILGEVLMSYRIHANQGSEMEVRKNFLLPDICKVINYYLPLVADAEVAAFCRRALDRTTLKTALKQNCVGEFAMSSATLANIADARYRLVGRLVRVANALRLNLHVWP